MTTASSDNPHAQVPNERQAILYALAAVALWSTVATGFKLGLQTMTVLQLLTVGCAWSCIVFLVAAIWTNQWRPSATDLRWSLGLGLLNPLAYYLILFAAYHRLPAYVAQPLNYTWAITLALLAIPLLKQIPTRRQLAGILVSYTGVVVLLTTAAESTTQQPLDWPGVGLALASTLLWSIYWLLNARTPLRPVLLMLWSFALATPIVAAICWQVDGLPQLTLQTLGFGAWVGVVEMGVAFLLWQAAMRRTRNAARIGQLIFLSPFVSLWIIRVVLEEPVGAAAFAALAIIVSGIVLARPAMRQIP